MRQCSISDKPIGAFLSGGLDSSTIVALLKEVKESFPVYSIDWKEEDYSEGFYHKLLCQSLDLHPKIVYCTSKFMAQYFDHIVSLYGEPFGDESMIPTHCIARRAKEEVDVVLTGDGADEFFHGYERYFFEDPTADYVDTFAPIDRSTWKLIFKKEFYDQTVRSPLDYSTEWKVSKEHTLRDRSLSDLLSYLPDDILLKVDRATMGVGLEARAPFLMQEVTSMALSASLEQLQERSKMRGKKLLREAVRELLPKGILLRKKQGFGVPLGEWFQKDLHLWMKERLLYGALNQMGWFSKKGLEILCTSPGRYSRAIFNLLVLESWMRKNDPLQNNVYRASVAVN
ncbi:MAG: asparagine synthase C-terminal domain-containing protein [Simkaniaceae bacterium]|nr:asparagine synthase C-terminal domain-containing protein [Simkaniaceae bacterium]